MWCHTHGWNLNEYKLIANTPSKNTGDFFFFSVFGSSWFHGTQPSSTKFYQMYVMLQLTFERFKRLPIFHSLLSCLVQCSVYGRNVMNACSIKAKEFKMQWDWATMWLNNLSINSEPASKWMVCIFILILFYLLISKYVWNNWWDTVSTKDHDNLPFCFYSSPDTNRIY